MRKCPFRAQTESGAVPTDEARLNLWSGSITAKVSEFWEFFPPFITPTHPKLGFQFFFLFFLPFPYCKFIPPSGKPEPAMLRSWRSGYAEDGGDWKVLKAVTKSVIQVKNTTSVPIAFASLRLVAQTQAFPLRLQNKPSTHKTM